MKYKLSDGTWIKVTRGEVKEEVWFGDGYVKLHSVKIVREDEIITNT